MNQSWAGADFTTINKTVYIEEDPWEDTCPVRCRSVRILRPTNIRRRDLGFMPHLKD